MANGKNCFICRQQRPNTIFASYFYHGVLFIAALTWQTINIDAQTLPRLPYCNDDNSTIKASIEEVFLSERVFSLKLYKAIAKRSLGVFVIQTADTFIMMSALRYGAAGETEQELCECLEIRCDNCYDQQYGYQRLVYKKEDIENSNLKMANQIFYRDDLDVKEQFEDIMNMTFHSKALSLKPTRAIDVWHENHMNKRFTTVFGPISSNFNGNESLVPVIAGYFNNPWAKDFKRCTEKMIFKGGKIYMDTYFEYIQTVGLFNYGEIDEIDAKYVEIIWEPSRPENNLRLYIILPNELDGLGDLEQKITEKTIHEKVFKGSTRQKVRIIMPKFTILMDIDLEEHLPRMNVNKIFDDDADLTRITDDRHARVHKIVHRVWIDGFDIPAIPESESCSPVNSTVNDKDNNKEFHVDHPFMIIFAINDEYPVTLFMGRIVHGIKRNNIYGGK